MNSPVNAVNAQKSFELFVPGVRISDVARTSLMNVTAASAARGMTILDQWRFVLHVLCISPSADSF